MIPRRFIRQQSKESNITWLTKTSKENDAIYCISGGVGWESQPLRSGFELRVTSEDFDDAVNIDVTRNATIWQSDSKLVQVVYLPTWKSEEDSAGFIFIKIPPTDSSVVKFSVSSRSENSMRWFAIDTPQFTPESLETLGRALGIER